jgi:RNA polymerase sigma-70 factor (ECF subfamily)
MRSEQELRSAELRDLVTRAQAYDEAALSGLFDIYYPKVYSYGLLQLRDVQGAEDLASDVMLRVLESISRYQSRGVPFSAWVFRIARNRLVDIRRRSHRRREVGLQESIVATIAAGNSPHQAVEKAIDFGEVCFALGQLTEAQEQVIMLRFLRDLDVATVARILGRSESAVKSIQFRALTALRRIMQPDESIEENAPTPAVETPTNGRVSPEVKANERVPAPTAA